MLATSSEETLLKDLEREVQPLLDSIGLFHRLFGRVKSVASIIRKDEIKKYSQQGSSKKMQDLFGLRVALYFADDEDIVAKMFAKKFSILKDVSEVDDPDATHFGPRRNNLIIRLPEKISASSFVLQKYGYIDSTFEVQLRTVFSEGWHEVDHDLRYKCKDDWSEHGDLARNLNGLAATLETCDWAAIQMFDQLAWRHYKAQKWQACFRAKFRLRLQSDSIDQAVLDLLNSNPQAAKDIFRTQRKLVMEILWQMTSPIPITLQNILFIANRLSRASNEMRDLEPKPISEWLDRYIGSWV